MKVSDEPNQAPPTVIGNELVTIHDGYVCTVEAELLDPSKLRVVVNEHVGAMLMANRIVYLAAAPVAGVDAPEPAGDAEFGTGRERSAAQVADAIKARIGTFLDEHFGGRWEAPEFDALVGDVAEIGAAVVETDAGFDAALEEYRDTAYVFDNSHGGEAEYRAARARVIDLHCRERMRGLDELRAWCVEQSSYTDGLPGYRSGVSDVILQIDAMLKEGGE